MNETSAADHAGVLSADWGIEQVTRDIVHALGSSDDIEQKVICLGDDGVDGELVRKCSQSIHDWNDDTEIIRCGSICQIAS